MSKDYTLTWSNGMGNVSCGEQGEYMFTAVNVPPALPFLFDALFYETPTRLAFKILNGERLALSEEEIAACRAFCDGYLDAADYPVQAYESESGLFRGTMLKSEAAQAGYSWIIGEAPDHPASKLAADGESGRWVRIAAVIRSDGSYALMPASVCPSCVLMMTAEEWAEFPKPARSTERWDFTAEAWQDSRTAEEAKKRADAWIRQNFITKRRELMGSAPYQELATWPWQIAEAQAWQADNGAETPFLDAVLDAMNEDTADKTGKAELVAAVLRYTSAEWLGGVGRVHGEMYAQIRRLRAAETLAEIDALTDAIAARDKLTPPTFALSFTTDGDGVVSSGAA